MQGQPTRRAWPASVLPEEQQGLALEGEGQPGHRGAPKGRKHRVLSSVCPSRAGSWVEQRWPEAARARLFTSPAPPQPQFSQEEACVCSHAWLPSPGHREHSLQK